MKCKILHESRGRIRVHFPRKYMSMAEADQLEAYLNGLDGVRQATVYDRICDAVILYRENREGIIQGLARFRMDPQALTAPVPENSGRALNRTYQEKMVNMVLFYGLRKLYLPAPLRIAYTAFRSIRFLLKGVRCLLQRKLEVEVLDALSIGVSMARGDFGTAGSVMFLLNIGELLEEWTRKKSLNDLARSLSLNVDRVWLKTADSEVLVPISQVLPGDQICIHTGNVIPLDGRVVSGEASVNQRIRGGTEKRRRRGICRHCGGRGRMRDPGGAAVRLRSLRSDRDHDPGVREAEIRHGEPGVEPGG